jgi:hypothetical protein
VAVRVHGNTAHGHAAGEKRSLTYSSWLSMNQRTSNPNALRYHRYGGRGLQVCARWKKFENFLSDMGPRPSLQHTLERKKNNAGYTPKNCVWATRTEQARNRISNCRLTFRGKTRTAVEWAEIVGLQSGTIVKRHRTGWSVSKTLTTPSRKGPK